MLKKASKADYRNWYYSVNTTWWQAACILNKFKPPNTLGEFMKELNNYPKIKTMVDHMIEDGMAPPLNEIN